MSSIVRLSCALTVFLGLSAGASASDLEPIPEACAPMVGTFVSKKRDVSGPEPKDSGRSLMAFTNGGHAILADSNQGGSDQYAGFTNAMGAWSCHVAGDQLTFHATIIDFTFLDNQHPKQQVVRLEIKGVLGTDGAMNGVAEVFFYPLLADPFGEDPEASLTYDFEAQKIVVTTQ